LDDQQGGGFHFGGPVGSFSQSAGGDIIGGDKTINNYIQSLIKALNDTPYKFLESYDVRDRDIFYGRDAVIAELEALVGRHKVILINGASGSGKTSLVNAGLIPRVAENGYAFVRIREYTDPLAQLQDYFDTAQGPPTPQAPVRTADGEGSLWRLLRSRGTFPMVVILDQFERFLIKVDEQKRRAFMADFSHCLRHSDATQLCFVLAFRREFLG
jgi:hypothetical protein